MARIMWVCDSCDNSDDSMPWDCPACGRETCEHCFGAFAHCRECSTGKTDDELRQAANVNGYDFEPNPEPSKDTEP